MHYFCTLFDSNYLLRGLTLYRSLEGAGVNFTFYILCLDDKAHAVISNLRLGNLLPITLKEIEDWDEELIVAKANRSKVEYYFTLKSLLPSYILKENNGIDIITYLDADLFFFDSPEVLYKEMSFNSVFMIKHNFSKEAEKRFSKHGEYNAEYMSFRNDKEGRACLERWGKQCKEWCYDTVKGKLYADQGYLNEWPSLYENLVVSENEGAGLAPWNSGRYQFSINDSQIYVNNDRLVFFHFHGVKIISKCFISQNLRSYGVKLPRNIKASLYKRYIIELKETFEWFKSSGVSDINFIDNLIGKRVKFNSDRKLIDRLKNFISSLYFTC